MALMYWAAVSRLREYILREFSSLEKLGTAFIVSLRFYRIG